MKRRIEVFTVDCPLCKETLSLLRQEACTECEIVERRCSGDECCEEALDYGVKAVPTVVVDGKIRLVGKPNLAEVRNIFTEVMLKSKIKCPFCGYVKEETMSVDSCQFYYNCTNCKRILRPKEGDCCVFCSYGSIKCPPKQRS